MKGTMLAATLLLSSCAGLPTAPTPPGGECYFPPGTHFAFIGKTSLLALGLSDHDSRIGKWWVSSERVSWLWRPLPPSVPTPLPSRQACGVFDDGAEVDTLGVPENWHPPINVHY